MRKYEQAIKQWSLTTVKQTVSLMQRDDGHNYDYYYELECKGTDFRKILYAMNQLFYFYYNSQEVIEDSSMAGIDTESAEELREIADSSANTADFIETVIDEVLEKIGITDFELKYSAVAMTDEDEIDSLSEEEEDCYIADSDGYMWWNCETGTDLQDKVDTINRCNYVWVEDFAD